MRGVPVDILGLGMAFIILVVFSLYLAYVQRASSLETVAVAPVQGKQAVPAIEPSVEVEPNFVCRNTRTFHAHLENGDLAEGGIDVYPSSPDDTNMGLVVLEICNEFSTSRKVAAVDYVTAQIVYTPCVGRAIQVNRGAWLLRSNRVNSFQVNDVHRLIIAGVGNFWEQDYGTFIINREFTEHEVFEMLTTALHDSFYRVEVSLISESRGKLFQKFDFSLAITSDPRIALQLTEIKTLPAKEVCRQLETFLYEGNQILKVFPTDQEKKPADVKKIDEWEKEVVRFITNQNPDGLSVAAFLSDFPMVQRGGYAHSSNWSSLNRLTTRLGRLKESIDILRK